MLKKIGSRVFLFIAATLVAFVYAFNYDKFYYVIDSLYVSEISDQFYARIICFVTGFIATAIIFLYRMKGLAGLAAILFFGLVYLSSWIYAQETQLLPLLLKVNITALVVISSLLMAFRYFVPTNK